MARSYNEIINWIENYFKENSDTKCYRGFEYSPEFKADVEKARNQENKEHVEFSIDPMLPVDLITVRKTRRKSDDPKDPDITYHYYQLFWLVFEEREDLIRKLQFYRFYLSRISNTNTVEIILVGSDVQANLTNFVNIAKDKGFGLWNINSCKVRPTIIVNPVDYRERMSNIFKDPKAYDEKLEVFSKEITIKAKDITLFYDGFINEAIEAMVGITPKQIGKRYIERTVLDFVFDLKNITYKKILQDSVSQHLIDKGDDYDFISRLFSELLKECGINSEYSDFLKIFEPPLYNIFSASKAPTPYRDHYFHQFQVFILGLIIIDKYYSRFGKDIEAKWFITSAFHDISYPIQKFDGWAKQFFSESIGIPDLGVTDISKHFVDKSLLSCTADIISELCKRHLPEKKLNGNWIRGERELIKIYHTIITESKHHGILSSIFLLKEAERLKISNKLKSSELFESLFVPSSFSISLHHNIKYSIKNSKNENESTSLWKELHKHGLNSIDFNSDPLTYLLIFCDTAQEWGRPTDYPSIENNVHSDCDKSFRLKDFYIDESTCHIKLKANFLSTDDIFDYKMKELVMVRDFLAKEETIKFQITLIDNDDEAKDYIMKGK